MKQPKYTIDDVVYIAFWNNVIECIVKEIHITDSYINYKLQNKQKSIDVYLRNEDKVFETIDQAEKFIQKRNLIDRINNEESKVAEYRGWVLDLDYAIENYNNCRIEIKINLVSNQTNDGEDKKLFGVTNTGSKTLLQYIKKYYEETLKSIEDTIEELKKQQEE